MQVEAIGLASAEGIEVRHSQDGFCYTGWPHPGHRPSPCVLGVKPVKGAEDAHTRFIAMLPLCAFEGNSVICHV